MTPKDTIYNGADEKTRAFSAKLIPTKKAIIGLKTPFVKASQKISRRGNTAMYASSSVRFPMTCTKNF